MEAKNYLLGLFVGFLIGIFLNLLIMSTFDFHMIFGKESNLFTTKNNIVYKLVPVNEVKPCP